MKLNEAALTKAGYKKFKTTLSNADYGYQKKVWEGSRIKYFIQFMHYSVDIPGRERFEAYEADVQFRKKDHFFNIIQFSDMKSIKAVEGYFEQIWQAIEADYYE